MRPLTNPLPGSPAEYALPAGRTDSNERTGPITSLQRLALLPAVVVLAAASLLTPTATAGASPATLPFVGHGSIGEAYVTGAPPGAHLVVLNASGAKVGSGTVDRLGSLVVRNLTPGPGYRFAAGTDSGAHRTAAFSVLSTSSTPPASFYSGQQLHAGLNYVRMRDGILLAATVRLPPGKTLADGPFPTVIEYSGYNVAGPHSLIDALEGQASSSDPLLPDTSTVVGSVVAPLLGFATVSVQMRGTGCSGGAFDLFGLPSDYDGYDVVQAVGAQPWVLNHKVGMVGISYSGFSQLIVAGTDPPDLAAITPLSPTDDLYSTGYPGGIYNDGFAASWVAQRASDARPAPGGGQPWATAEIATGDKTCLANQRLHLQAQSLESLVSPNLGRTPALFNPRSPTAWASSIRVPVFLVGALQDEQVGPQWPALIAALHGDKNVYVTMMNGTHTDSLGPDTISRWLEFLDLYVADRVPTPSPTLDALAPTLYSSLTGGAPSAPVPAVRFTKRAFGRRSEGRLRGAGPTGAGALRQRWRIARAGCAPTHLRGGVLFLATHRHGAPLRPRTSPARCRRARRRDSSTASFRPDPSVRPADDLAASANAWAAQPPYNWTTVPGSQRDCVRDTRLRQRHHDRRARQPQPDAQVDRTRHRPAGDGHRGPARRDARGVRHLGLPAQQRSRLVAPPRPRSTRRRPT